MVDNILNKEIDLLKKEGNIYDILSDPFSNPEIISDLNKKGKIVWKIKGQEEMNSSIRISVESDRVLIYFNDKSQSLSFLSPIILKSTYENMTNHDDKGQIVVNAKRGQIVKKKKGEYPKYYTVDEIGNQSLKIANVLYDKEIENFYHKKKYGPLIVEGVELERLALVPDPQYCNRIYEKEMCLNLKVENTSDPKDHNLENRLCRYTNYQNAKSNYCINLPKYLRSSTKFYMRNKKRLQLLIGIFDQHNKACKERDNNRDTEGNKCNEEKIQDMKLEITECIISVIVEEMRDKFLRDKIVEYLVIFEEYLSDKQEYREFKKLDVSQKKKRYFDDLIADPLYNYLTDRLANLLNEYLTDRLANLLNEYLDVQTTDSLHNYLNTQLEEYANMNYLFEIIKDIEKTITSPTVVGSGKQRKKKSLFKNRKKITSRKRNYSRKKKIIRHP